MDFLLEGLLYIIVFSCILFLAYVTTRFVAGRSIKAMKGKYMNVVETISLGMDKRLHLVKVGEQYILISTSGKSVEFIKEVRLKDFEETAAEPAPSGSFDFKSFFEKYVQLYRDKKITKKAGSNPDGSTEGEHTGRIKNNLNRLREINQRISAQVKNDGEVDTNDK